MKNPQVGDTVYRGTRAGQVVNVDSKTVSITWDSHPRHLVDEYPRDRVTLCYDNVWSV